MAQAQVTFRSAGGRFEGTVDSTGLVISGSTGTVPVSVVALVPGSRPFVHRVEVKMPGPAARLRVEPPVRRVVVGLTPSWSFAPGHGVIAPDGAFVGYERGEYVVTASYGVRTAEAPVTLAHRDVRRQLQVVARVPRTLFTTEEVWIHPNGRVAYLGTGGGGDRMYAIDISDPARPVVTDSILANTRRVNDIMTTPDGRFMVFTREGAADRRNGIVIASLEDPLHPKPIAEFTEGVTAGVHSAFIYRQERYGTHVYLTNDGTGAMHVVDIGDPYIIRARWRSGAPRAARMPRGPCTTWTCRAVWRT